MRSAKVRLARWCAGFVGVRSESNRDETSFDLFGKLKAEVRVTRLTRKSRTAAELRTLLTIARRFCQSLYLLVEHKNHGAALVAALVRSMSRDFQRAGSCSTHPNREGL
jgi:hypothetical protein